MNFAVEPQFCVLHLHWPKMYLDTNKSLHYIFYVIYCKERCTSALLKQIIWQVWAAKPIDLVLKMKTISVMFVEHVRGELNHTSTKTPADSKTFKLRKWWRGEKEKMFSYNAMTYFWMLLDVRSWRIIAFILPSYMVALYFKVT